MVPSPMAQVGLGVGQRTAQTVSSTSTASASTVTQPLRDTACACAASGDGYELDSPYARGGVPGRTASDLKGVKPLTVVRAHKRGAGAGKR